MAEVLPVPILGDVFQDVRADQRTMRVSFHQGAGMLVVSLWSGGLCRASFRMAAGEVGRLSTMLADIAGKVPHEPDAEPYEPDTEPHEPDAEPYEPDTEPHELATKLDEPGTETEKNAPESGGDDEPGGSGTAESGHVGT
jgi:hypothetical protein